MIRFIFQALRQAYQRIFRGNKPTPQVKPPVVKNSPKPDAKPKTEKPENTQKEEPKETFWQDRLKSEGGDDKRSFYEKYRSRLQNQDPDLGHER